MTVIDYVDGVQGLSPATGRFELWHWECAAEVTIIGDGFNLLQPATDADVYKCKECGKSIPIIRRNMPGYHIPGYDRVGDGPDDWDWAPFVRLFNHVREQLPSWVEQVVDWLSNLPGFFRAGLGRTVATRKTTAFGRACVSAASSS